jgi:hypothetical protein
MTTYKNNTAQQQPSNDHDSDKIDPTNNMMRFIKDLIGYEYYTSRAAFDHNGTEVVLVNEGLISRISIYVDGEHELSRFTCASTIKSSTYFNHNDNDYRVTTSCRGWFQSAQIMTLYVNDVEVDKKIDQALAGLNWQQRIHVLLGATLLGALIGGIIKVAI